MFAGFRLQLAWLNVCSMLLKFNFHFSFVFFLSAVSRGNKLTLIIDVNFRLQYSQCYFNLNNSGLSANIALSLPPNNIYWKLEFLSELCKVQQKFSLRLNVWSTLLVGCSRTFLM